MVGLKKAEQTVIEATEQIKDSSNLLLAVAGISVVIATVALIVACVK
jgi:hypothetical protein